MKNGPLTLSALLVLLLTLTLDSYAELSAKQILSATGVKGGLVVHLGCAEGRLTAGLCRNDGYLVHGLDADPADIESARNHIAKKGLYGKVCVELFSARRLPYNDNAVNLLIADDLGDISMDEFRVIIDQLSAEADELDQLRNDILTVRATVKRLRGLRAANIIQALPSWLAIENWRDLITAGLADETYQPDQSST